MDGHLIHAWGWDGESYPEKATFKLRLLSSEETTRGGLFSCQSGGHGGCPRFNLSGIHPPLHP